MTNKWNQKKSPELVQRALELEASGKSWRFIAELLGVSKGTIRNWLHPECQTNSYKIKSNRTRQNKRNYKYKTDPLYRIKQLLRTAKAKADREGYSACSSKPEEILATLTEHCECCHKHENECGTLCLDHWHEPPALFRAWLCHDCNIAIGLFKDDPAIIRSAAQLLEKRTNDDQRQIQRSD